MFMGCSKTRSRVVRCRLGVAALSASWGTDVPSSCPAEKHRTGEMRMAGWLWLCCAGARLLLKWGQTNPGENEGQTNACDRKPPGRLLCRVWTGGTTRLLHHRASLCCTSPHARLKRLVPMARALCCDAAPVRRAAQTETETVPATAKYCETHD